MQELAACRLYRSYSGCSLSKVAHYNSALPRPFRSPSALRADLFLQRQKRRGAVKVNLVGRKGSLSLKESFFDRERESSLLREQLTQQPTHVLVVLGPASSGKTALLKHVLGGLSETGVPVSYVSTRSFNMTNPDGFADALAYSAWRNVAMYSKAMSDLLLNLGVMIDAGPVDAIRSFSKMCSMAVASPPPLSTIIQTYTKVIRDTPAGGPWPVLVIDEANTLTSWDPKFKAERAAIIRFLVQASKEENKAHVVLATSDSAFINWIESEMQQVFFKVQVVGDFSRDDAKAFLMWELESRNIAGANLDEGTWNRIYEVCGGNAGQLKQCASAYKGNWDAVIATLGTNEYRHVRGVLSPLPGAGWTTAQVVAVMRALCDSDHGAVVREDLEAALGEGGKTAVVALLQADVLGLRLGYSEWASDLPLEVWGGDPQATLITAASAAHLRAMRKVVKELQSKGPEDATTMSASGSQAVWQQEVSSSLVQIDNELQKVAKDLEDVADEIKTVATEVKQLQQDKPDGWLEEVSFLRRREEHLRTEKEQLHRKKEQLRRKEEQLRQGK